jgi:hypothetical protein
MEKSSNVCSHIEELQKKQDEALDILREKYYDYWLFREFLVDALLNKISYKGYSAILLLQKWVASFIDKTNLEYFELFVVDLDGYAGDLLVGMYIYGKDNWWYDDEDKECYEEGGKTYVKYGCQYIIDRLSWHELFVIIFDKLRHQTNGKADILEALVILDRVIEIDKYICERKETR